MPSTPAAALRRTARHAFGYSNLRPGQLEAMTSVLAGRDTVVVMPTASGKSAIYQVPALLRTGATVVVSPLVSLQRDQVQKLSGEAATGGAASANSTQRVSEREAAFERLQAGEMEFLFLAPEQLAKEEVLAALERADVSLVAVDEAHCVSSWGHDFRPDYLRLGEVIDRLGHPPVVALTATAAPPVRDDIVSRLGLRDPTVVVRGFDRPNISLHVRHLEDEEAKRDAVIVEVAALPKPGILYTATRRSTESYAGELQQLGLRADPYHAGRRAADRRSVQDAFLAGDCDVIVATTAFGMGIDKPDVRFVIHADIAESPDAYYQEVGRAGRDGEPAQAVLFYRPADLGVRKFFASGTVDRMMLERLARLVRLHPGPVSRADLVAEAEVSRSRGTSYIELLQQVGAVTLDRRGRLRVPSGAPDPAEAARLAVEVAENRQSVEKSRVEMMRGYAETTGCRRQYLLGYFGETLAEPCGNCDTCLEGSAQAEASAAAYSPYRPGSRLRHAEWGAGSVMRAGSDRMVVLFDEVGYKVLSLDALAGQDLVQPA